MLRHPNSRGHYGNLSRLLQPHTQLLCCRSPFLGLGAGGGGYRHAGEGGNASSINGVSLLTSQLAAVHCRPFGGFGGGGGGCGGGGGGGYSGELLLPHYACLLATSVIVIRHAIVPQLCERQQRRRWAFWF